MRRFFCAFIHADDDAARIEVVVERFGFPEEFRAEDDIVGVEFLADMCCIADGYRGFDYDGRLGGAVRSNVKDKSDDGFYSAAVEEVLLGVIVGRGGNDDVVGVPIGTGCVCGCREVKRARAAFGFCEVLFYVVILNGADVVVEFFDFLRHDVYCGDMIVLRKQDGQGEADVAGACYCDAVGGGWVGGYRIWAIGCRGVDGGGVRLFYEDFRRIEAQDFCECLELVDGRGVFLCFKVAEYGAVHAAGSG